MTESYHIGEWLVEPMLHKVSKDGVTRKLEPQLMAVLQLLASKPGEVVTKDELRDTVWADVIVTENVLTRAISSLRKILDDNRTNPIYIETISKTGYRMIAPVKRKAPKRDTETFTIKLARRPVILGLTITVFIVLGAFATRSIFLPVSAEKVYNPSIVANHSTTEYWPAISPDGRFVAYGWRGEKSDNWDIYAKLVGTENTLRITDNPATELRAVWSPDGNYVYYVRYEQGGGTIYKKGIVGGEEIRVLTTPQFSSGNFDISPDEKWVSLNDRETRTSPLRVKLVSLETGEEKWLTQPEQGYNGDLHPTFSQDGSKVAFIREKNSTSMHLWTFDLRTERLDQITTEHISINGFDWHENGRSIIYGANYSGLYKLWEVDVNSKESKLMPIGDYQMVMPRVANNGEIIYAKMKDNVNIWSFDLQTNTAEAWRSTNKLDLNPVLSPTGDKLCFTTNKDDVFQIWVANADRSEAVPITNFIGQYINRPRWSPDGQFITFQGFLEGQSDIYRVNALGGVPENLTTSRSDDHAPVYSADGQHIFFSSNRSGKWGIWRMDLDGGGLTEIVENQAFGAQLSPDGEMLYYPKKDKYGLWQFDLNTKEEEQVTADFHPANAGAFAVTKEGIYYLNMETSAFELLDLTTDTSKFIYKPRRIPRLGTTLSASADGLKLYYTQVDLNDADIMRLEEQLP